MNRSHDRKSSKHCRCLLLHQGDLSRRCLLLHQGNPTIINLVIRVTLRLRENNRLRLFLASLSFLSIFPLLHLPRFPPLPSYSSPAAALALSASQFAQRLLGNQIFED